MHIDIISAVPELLVSPFQHSILKIAQAKGLVTIEIHNLHDYGMGKHRKVDDYCYGGAAGLVLRIEPVDKCLTELKQKRAYDEIIYLAPDGILYTQAVANQFATLKNIVLICGHYKGIDQRIRDHLVTKEISIGDYVLSGGELAAGVVVDSLVRLLPGVLSNSESALTDSFQDNLVAPPVYTRPRKYKNWEVPVVLLSGHHRQIEDWEMQQAQKLTKQKRPNLLTNYK